MKQDNQLGSSGDPAKNHQVRQLLELEQADPATEETTAAYLSTLYAKWIRGETIEGQALSIAHPPRFASTYSEEFYRQSYPIYFDPDVAKFISFYPILEQSLLAQFDEDSARIISEHLTQVFSDVRSKLAENGKKLQAQQLIMEVSKVLSAIDLPEEDPSTRLDKVRDDLLQRVNLLLDFNTSSAFQLLSLQNQKNDGQRQAFLATLKKVRADLAGLLRLQNSAGKSPLRKLDFAEELMSLDKIEEVSVAKVSSYFPPERLTRLRSTLETLSAAQKTYTRRNMTVFASKELEQVFNLKQIFDDAVMQTGGAMEAKVYATACVQEFVEVMAALQTGKLMVNQQYDEALHDAYFDNFDLKHLSPDELRYFPPIVLIANSRDLMESGNDLLGLLSNTGIVKILGVNLLDEIRNLDDTAIAPQLELAALGICRRNSFVFQGGLDTPVQLQEAYQRGLAFPGPAFWNILLPSPETYNSAQDFTTLRAAAESRYFPRLTYEPKENHFASEHLNLADNLAPAAAFVTYELAVKSATGVTVNSYNLSPADFLVTESRWQNQFLVLPAAYQSVDLLPLTEYLQIPRHNLHQKMPFIWLADQDNKLQRVLVPAAWISTCRERLEYWDFLQILSGSKLAQQTTEQLRAELEQEKQAELAQLKATLAAQFTQTRSNDLEQAVTRMLQGLLSDEKGVEAALAQMTTHPPPIEPSPEPESANEQEVEKPLVEAPSPSTTSDEAWVESEECTSCKDCVEALPAVFKYDDNKQAYVHNPKGGTFAKIVATAEKCPAACIHPGKPQNESEPDLEKWIMRAEKYN